MGSVGRELSCTGHAGGSVRQRRGGGGRDRERVKILIVDCYGCTYCSKQQLHNESAEPKKKYAICAALEANDGFDWDSMTKIHFGTSKTGSWKKLLIILAAFMSWYEYQWPLFQRKAFRAHQIFQWIEDRLAQHPHLVLLGASDGKVTRL